MTSDWIGAATLLSGVGTLAIFIVWSFYAKLAFDQYREQRRPWFILESGGPELSSPCFLINMSPQTAHISSILAVLHTSERCIARRIRSPGKPEPGRKCPAQPPR